MLNIIYIFLLIIIFLYISPIVDHLANDYDETNDSPKIIIECIVQLFIIGMILYALFVTNEHNIIKNTFKLKTYDRLLIDLIFTIVFIGTQSNLTKKLEHITHAHPIRKYFIGK